MQMSADADAVDVKAYGNGVVVSRLLSSCHQLLNVVPLLL
jgi:hypothetical protein